MSLRAALSLLAIDPGGCLQASSAVYSAHLEHGIGQAAAGRIAPLSWRIVALRGLESLATD